MRWWPAGQRQPDLLRWWPAGAQPGSAPWAGYLFEAGIKSKPAPQPIDKRMPSHEPAPAPAASPVPLMTGILVANPSPNPHLEQKSHTDPRCHHN